MLQFNSITVREEEYVPNSCLSRFLDLEKDDLDMFYHRWLTSEATETFEAVVQHADYVAKVSFNVRYFNRYWLAPGHYSYEYSFPVASLVIENENTCRPC